MISEKRLCSLFLVLISAMASELTCSICQNIHTDPATLTCGHSFCRLCLDNAPDAQEGSGLYGCPECKAETQRSSTSESCVFPNLKQDVVVVSCTYCDSAVPAVRTCFHCEVSLCGDHLEVHSTSEEHVFAEPTTSFQNIKCSIHNMVIEYYCPEDAAYQCSSCRLDEEHCDHQLESLVEVCEKKKETLRNILETMTTKRKVAKQTVLHLQEHRKEVQEKAIVITKQSTYLIRYIREQLEALEKRVLSEISRQEEEVSLRVSELIQQLEQRDDELSKQMGHIEELCNMTNPLTFLQGWESDRADLHETIERDGEDQKRHDKQVRAVGQGHLDVGLISVTLHTGLDDIVACSRRHRNVPEAPDILLNSNTGLNILLDVKTAAYNVDVFEDLKTVFWSETKLRRPKAPERFQDYPQVLSTRSFSSGRHYWEVETSKSGNWSVGLTYGTIDRKGLQSAIGNNKKSWSVEASYNQYSIRHDNKVVWSPHRTASQRIGMLLDYGVGQLSFYELGEPILHIHTFNATFTEPLHLGICVWQNTWMRIRSQEC